MPVKPGSIDSRYKDALGILQDLIKAKRSLETLSAEDFDRVDQDIWAKCVENMSLNVNNLNTVLDGMHALRNIENASSVTGIVDKGEFFV